MDIRKFTQMKERLEQLQSETDRALGQLEQLTKQREDEFDCSDDKEAEKMLLKISKELKTKESEFEEEQSSFDEEFGERIDKEL